MNATKPENTTTKNIAIFASGTGSNAKKIIEYFINKSIASVALIVCNKPDAGVIDIAKSFGIDVLLINRKGFYEKDSYLKQLSHIDFIVLAGFLWKIPGQLIQHFKNRIINIHPALLPAYGGKGMYGSNVHQSVINNHEKQSGITIHYVDEHYDNGDIIFQETCTVSPEDTADTLAAKIHLLEHKYFSKVVEDCVSII